MSGESAKNANESAKETISRAGAPLVSEPAQAPELPGHPYKPYSEESAASEPYKPYAEKPALSDLPYEPYKGI